MERQITQERIIEKNLHVDLTSDIVFLSKEENKCFIVDIAVPEDARIAEKEKEKIEKKS